MTQADLLKLAMAGGILYAVYRFAPNPAIKAMALGAAGVAAFRMIPYTRDVLA